MAWLEVDESKFQSSFINIAAEQVNIGIYSSTIDNNPRSNTEEIPSIGVYIRGGVKFRKITGKYTAVMVSSLHNQFFFLIQIFPPPHR